MKVIENFDKVEATSGEYSKPGNGGYIIEILGVKNVEFNPNTGAGDYLRIEYDIADGEFAGYYSKMHEKFGGEWIANFSRSYKETALGMFKHFINCIEKSNPAFDWKWREHELVGCRIGVVLQEEEYTKKNGSVGVALKVKEVKTIEQILDKDFVVPETKKLKASVVEAPVFQPVNSDDDMPF